MPDRGLNERELDRFLNDLSAGMAADRRYDLDGNAIATVVSVRSMARSRLPQASCERLDAEILAQIGAAQREEVRVLLLVDPHGGAVVARDAGLDTTRDFESRTYRLRRWRRHLPVQLATAALVLLTLVGSYVVFGPERQWRRTILSYLPASGGMQDSPAQVRDDDRDPDETDIAELVWMTAGGPDRPFIEPGQPAIAPDGNLWIPDRGYGQVLIFSPDGTFLEAWGAPGSGEGEFDFGSRQMSGLAFGGIAFDGRGNIYVADAGNARVQKFGPNRQFLTAWGSEGMGQGQFRRPAGIAVDGRGRVYVTDPGWGKIEVFDDAGDWLATWPNLGTPMGLAIDDAGDVWVAQSGSGITKFSPEGEQLAAWTTYGNGPGAFIDPKSVAIDAGGRILVSDNFVARVQVFTPDGVFLGSWGKLGKDPGGFQTPRGLAVDSEGNVYVTEDEADRVQKFRLTLPPVAPPDTS